MIEGLKVVAFDADDTLWENEPLFRHAERIVADSLSEYGSFEHISDELYKVEFKNMEDYGFGAKAYVLSMIENAINLSKGKVTAEQISYIIESGRDILHNPATPLPGVVETLDALKTDGRYTLVLFTKGELDVQEKKIALSLKFADSNPWNDAESKYAIDKVVTGKIARMTDFGAFVELEPGIDALLHVSQISREHIDKPSDVLSVGQEIEAKIVDFNEADKKISLSMKELLPDEPEAPEADADTADVDIEAVGEELAAEAESEEAAAEVKEEAAEETTEEAAEEKPEGE